MFRYFVDMFKKDQDSFEYIYDVDKKKLFDLLESIDVPFLNASLSFYMSGCLKRNHLEIAYFDKGENEVSFHQLKGEKKASLKDIFEHGFVLDSSSHFNSIDVKLKHAGINIDKLNFEGCKYEDFMKHDLFVLKKKDYCIEAFDFYWHTGSLYMDQGKLMASLQNKEFLSAHLERTIAKPEVKKRYEEVLIEEYSALSKFFENLGKVFPKNLF